MPDQATLQGWLDDCYQALQDLSTGVKVVSASSAAGKSVSYTAANVGLLRARIRELERLLGIASPARAATFQVGGH